MSWHTVNDTVLATGHQLLIADPTRFDGVQVLGVDEDAWRHTRRGDKFVIIDLTPVRDGTGPSRLLDMAEGPSKQVFKTWLEAQTPAFRDGIEIEAMDGFTGFKTAEAEVPDAVAVMDPFHGVALAGDALDRCRQSVQQDTCAHRGRGGDPLYAIRSVLRTGVGLLTDRQHSLSITSESVCCLNRLAADLAADRGRVAAQLCRDGPDRGLLPEPVGSVGCGRPHTDTGTDPKAVPPQWPEVPPSARQRHDGRFAGAALYAG